MRKLWTALAVLGGLSSWAGAAENKTHLRLAGGVGALTGDAGDGYKAGPLGAVALGRDLNGAFTVLVEAEYARLGVDEDRVFSELQETLPARVANLPREAVDIEGGKASLLSGTVHVKASILGHSSPVTPYVIGGGGLTRLSVDEATVTLTVPDFADAETVESVSETAASISFGGGLDFSVGGLSLFGEGRYHVAFTEEESTHHVTLRVGLSLRL